ncbi:hypothetical protein PHMEG_0007617 [Phytophthora megakarya]|uniref:Uncharacterized protein n=1 Tax=Phytophthora megakarya TaxID=4795 RepID=A0A225WM08_9STRA|nr:hypothetical protein PHMEG_0007617 [Phytophthora megakarya]
MTLLRWVNAKKKAEFYFSRIRCCMGFLNQKPKGNQSEWMAAALQQTPTELWEHKNELTAYQVWVAYRGATG